MRHGTSAAVRNTFKQEYTIMGSRAQVSVVAIGFLAWLILWVAFWSGIIWTAVHFIRKFW